MHFTKQGIQKANEQMRRYSITLAIRDMQVKIRRQPRKLLNWRQYQTLMRMQRNWIPHTLQLRGYNGTATPEDSVAVSCNTEHTVTV